jgi:hypothetical protein
MNESYQSYAMPRDPLRAALSVLGRIARHSRLPVCSAVQLGGGQMAATDLDCSAARYWPELEGPVWAVEYAPLAELAKSADKNSVIIVAPPTEEKVTATLVAMVGGSPLTRSAAFFPFEELPPLQYEGVKFEGPAQLFDAFGIEQIRRAFNFISEDQTRAVLSGVCLDARQSDGRIVATDGRRMFYSRAFNWVNMPPEKSVKLKNHRIWEAKELPAPWLIRADLGDRPHVEVRAGPWRIVAKTEDNFPNWRQCLVYHKPERLHFTASIYHDELAHLPAWLKALPRPERGTNTLQITGNGHLEFIHEASGARREVDARTDGPVVMAQFNTAFIAELCALGFRSWELLDELTPLVARGAAGDTVIVMPLRTEKTPDPTAASVPENAEPTSTAVPENAEPSPESAPDDADPVTAGATEET